MADEQTERFDAFLDAETRIAIDPYALPSEERGQLYTLIQEFRRLSSDVEKAIGSLNGIRSDVNRIDQQVTRLAVDVRSMSTTLERIDRPVRQIQTYLAALGEKLQQS
ncbi:MAG: hypothetical protein AB7I42_25920 [Bradyrhizobium sp.]|uniref:hypothetical protein n=1 Tax=Bradyrhizobium sp. TaxID=376 RepID=UPI003D10F540